MNDRVVAVEIGGTKLQLAVVGEVGKVELVHRGQVPAGTNAAGILNWFHSAVPVFLGEFQKSGAGNVKGFGIGFGGPVDSARGTVVTSHQIDGWDDYPLLAWFEELFGVPGLLENDSNCAGWAEYCCGAGRGTKQFCYMNIGSGIGGAFVIDGKLYTGQGLGAAEIGHTWIPDWTAKESGQAAKLEDRCSGWSIERRIQTWDDLQAGSPLHGLCGGDARKLSCAMLGAAAAEGDSRALAELERIAASIGVALGNVVTLVHPERIALGGGVALIGTPLLDPLRAQLARYGFSIYQERFELVPCELEEAVVTVGAGLLAHGALRNEGH